MAFPTRQYGLRGRLHMDDLNPESLWKFRVKGFGPLLVAMDSHGGNLYTAVKKIGQGRRAAALASMGVK